MRAAKLFVYIRMILFLGSLLILSGCWDRTEINDVALITGAAIDKAGPHSILLSVQLFVPRTAPGGGGSGSGVQTTNVGNQSSVVHSATGENIADALSHIQEKLPRKLFWGHAEVIVFSEDIAKDGIRDEIDYLMRAPQPRERAYLFVSNGKAHQVLDAHSFLERNTSEVMREIAKGKLSLSVTLAETAQMLVDETGAAALPWIDLTPSESSSDIQGPSLKNGTAVFKNGKLVGVVDEFTTRGILWIRDEIKQAVITVNPIDKESNVSLRLISSRTKQKPNIQNGIWSMSLQIRTQNNAIQNSTPLRISSDPEALKTVETAMNDDIEARVRLALNKVQKELKADIFDFGGAFHRAYPKEWEQNKAQWDEIFPKLSVTIAPHATIQRPGLTSIKEVEIEEASRK